MSHVTVPNGNPARTGESPGPGVAAEPRVVRRYTADAGRPSLPAVADGTLYVSDAVGNLDAFDVESGDRLWHRRADEAGPGTRGMPAVTSELVIASTAGRSCAFARADGKVRYEIAGGYACAVGDLILAHDAGVLAVDADSGQPRWRADTGQDGKACDFIYNSPTVTDTAVLAAEAWIGHHVHGGLHAFDRETGTSLWGHRDGDAPCDLPTPCDAHDDVDFAPFHPVAAHDLIWMVRGRNHETKEFLDKQDFSMELVGYDPGTGAERRVLTRPQWCGDDADGGYVIQAPVFGSELVYVLGDDRGDGRIEALDLTTGALRWSQRLSADVAGSALLAGGILHLATEDGTLHAYDAATGHPWWRLTLDEPVSWSKDMDEYWEAETPFTLAGGTIFVSTDNAVLALRSDDYAVSRLGQPHSVDDQ